MRIFPDASAATHGPDGGGDRRARLVRHTSACLAAHSRPDDRWDLLPLLHLEPFPASGELTVHGLRGERRLRLDISWDALRIAWHDPEGANGRFLARGTWEHGFRS